MRESVNIVLIVATFRRTLASLYTGHRTQFIYETIRIEGAARLVRSTRLNRNRLKAEKLIGSKVPEQLVRDQMDAVALGSPAQKLDDS
jgi:hypothetical protein